MEENDSTVGHTKTGPHGAEDEDLDALNFTSDKINEAKETEEKRVRETELENARLKLVEKDALRAKAKPFAPKDSDNFAISINRDAGVVVGKHLRIVVSVLCQAADAQENTKVL